MSLWKSPTTSPVERAAAAHEQRTGHPAAHTASAPANWVLIGENVDHFGGVTIMGLGGQRVAVTVSPRKDNVIAISGEGPHVEPFAAEATLAQLTAGEIEDPLTRRLCGLVQALITRQVLSRDTGGLDITIVSDVPVGAGLGAFYAVDAALALALAALALGGQAESSAGELDQPPLRARLAEICSQNITANSTLPLLRARHTVALRGTAGQVSVVDYADGSITQAPHPAKFGVRIFSIGTTFSAPYSEQAHRLSTWREFIDEAVENFGVTSLRELPDAVNRVVEWVEARRDAGDTKAPAPTTARTWVQFCETETLRSLAAAKALRSRRGNELFTLLNSPSEAHDIATPDALVSLALERGAAAARPAAAGASQAVIAFVPVAEADAFAASFADEFEVVEIVDGEPARVEPND